MNAEALEDNRKRTLEVAVYDAATAALQGGVAPDHVIEQAECACRDHREAREADREANEREAGYPNAAPDPLYEARAAAESALIEEDDMEQARRMA